MGIAIENANALVKLYVENIDNLQKALKQQTLKISQIDSMNYKLSYMFANSASGIQQNQSGNMEPLDTIVTLGINLAQFPNSNDKSAKYIKFGMSKDKFL